MVQDRIIDEIESRLGYSFRDRSLLVEALTHSSYAHEQVQVRERVNPGCDSLCHYERFEFLGDAVLGLVISDLLMRKYPSSREGELSRVRAGLVCAERLAEQAVELGLGDALLLGKGEAATGGREKASILAAAFEAVVAAVYMDSGFESARKMVLDSFRTVIAESDALDLLSDYKTPLQERVQARYKSTPIYTVVNEEGPDHEKVFEVEVRVNGQPGARGRGRSKKEAEQNAARAALKEWKRECGDTGEKD